MHFLIKSSSGFDPSAVLLTLVISKDKSKHNDYLKSSGAIQFSCNAIFILWGQILSVSSDISILTA